MEQFVHIVRQPDQLQNLESDGRDDLHPKL